MEPWKMGAGGRLWRLGWLIAWLFLWQFVASLAWVLRTLALCAMTVMSACNISFVELLLVLFRRFWGDVRREFMQRLFVALHGTLLWVPIFATLCKRMVLALWHALLTFGLEIFLPLFFFLLGSLYFFFL
jgi:hypothetical protein